MDTAAIKLGIGKRIKEIRENAGLSREDLAQKAILSLDYSRAIEKGEEEDISLRTLEKIAKTLDVNIADLLVV